MRNSYRAILVFMSVASLANCSSIVDGTSQEMVINTNPPGANCTLMRNGMPVGSVSSTPGAVLVEKTKYDITVKCDKHGYQEATFYDKSGVADATFGNIVLGGGIGWAIDSADGADNKYTSPINLSMVPGETHITSHLKHHKKKQIEASASQASADTDSASQPSQQPQGTPASNQSDYPTGRNGGAK